MNAEDLKKRTKQCYVMLRGILPCTERRTVCPEASLTLKTETLRSQPTLPQGDTLLPSKPPAQT